MQKRNSKCSCEEYKFDKSIILKIETEMPNKNYTYFCKEYHFDSNSKMYNTKSTSRRQQITHECVVSFKYGTLSPKT